MRKTRGLLFILVGLALAALSGYAVLSLSKQAADTAAANAQATAVANAQATATAFASIEPAAASQSIRKVFVVVAANDLAANALITAADVTPTEFPADFAPQGAIATTDIAIGKYTTTRIFKGEILVAPLLSEAKPISALAAQIPVGKVAMAVAVDDAMDNLGALHPGDHVDVLLSLDLKALAAVATPTSNQAPGPQPNQPAGVPVVSADLSTQLTMQNVEILAIGPFPADLPAVTAQSQATATPQPQQPQQNSRTITFLLDRQDAVTLKFIKDSGGTMDLVIRAPADEKLAQTEAVTLDSIYRKFSFRFVQPVQANSH